jgi:hypothetical protein
VLPQDGRERDDLGSSPPARPVGGTGPPRFSAARPPRSSGRRSEPQSDAAAGDVAESVVR